MIEFHPTGIAKAVVLGMLQSMEQAHRFVTWEKTGGDAMLWSKVREFGSCLERKLIRYYI